MLLPCLLLVAQVRFVIDMPRPHWFLT